MMMVLCSVSFGQPPMQSPECENLSQQIMAKQASIAFLNGRIATSQAALTAAETAAASMAATAANNPLYAQYYNLMAAYYLAQAVYWTGEIADDQFLKTAKQNELTAAQEAYALAGC